MSVAARPVRARGRCRSCGSAAAGAAQDGGCRSSLAQLQLIAEAAVAVRIIRRRRSSRRRLPEQLGCVAVFAEATVAVQIIRLVLARRSSSCPEWLEAGLPEQLGSAPAPRRRGCQSSYCQLLLVWHETEAAAAAQFSCGAIPMLPEQLGSIAAGAARVGCRWSSSVQLAVASRG